MRLILLFVLCVSSQAANYYVANAGNDSCNGIATTIGTSGACAWKTLAHVNAHTFSPGDSVLLNRGDTWNELLKVPSSGSSGNPITFSAYGTGAIPIIDGTSLTVGAGSGLVTISSKTYITLDSLEIRNSSRDGIAAYQANNFTLTNSSIHANQFNGVFPYDCSNVLISGNQIYGNALTTTTVYNGIIVDGDGGSTFPGVTITNNKIYSNIGGPDGFTDGANGIYIGHQSGAPTFTGMVISNNEIYLNGNTTQNQAGRGILGDTTGGDITVTHNWIHDNAAAGAFIGDSGYSFGLTYTYNTFSNNHLRCFGFYDNSNPVIYNNTCYSGSSSYTGIGLEYNGTGAPIVKDNVFAVALDPSFGGFVLSDNGVIPSAISNNVYFNLTSGNAISHAFVQSSSGTYISYTAWVTATGDTSTVADPQLNNPSANDFTLQDTSPARNHGAVIAGVNNTFSYGAPDLGAYPYYAKSANSLTF